MHINYFLFFQPTSVVALQIRYLKAIETIFPELFCVIGERIQSVSIGNAIIVTGGHCYLYCSGLAPWVCPILLTAPAEHQVRLCHLFQKNSPPI